MERERESSLTERERHPALHGRHPRRTFSETLAVLRGWSARRILSATLETVNTVELFESGRQENRWSTSATLARAPRGPPLLVRRLSTTRGCHAEPGASAPRLVGARSRTGAFPR